ncbi:hypothetical protein HN011_012561 [Eciton burchellii]|nr:hypothetical protein HN011_012561 [Eciton burchellii]
MDPRKIPEDVEERRRIKRRQWLVEQDFLRRHDERKKKMIEEYERERARKLSKNKPHLSSDDISRTLQQENVVVRSQSERSITLHAAKLSSEFRIPSRPYEGKSEIIKKDLSRIKVMVDMPPVSINYNTSRNQSRNSNLEDKILLRRQGKEEVMLF